MNEKTGAFHMFPYYLVSICLWTVPVKIGPFFSLCVPLERDGKSTTLFFNGKHFFLKKIKKIQKTFTWLKTRVISNFLPLILCVVNVSKNVAVKSGCKSKHYFLTSYFYLWKNAIIFDVIRKYQNDNIIDLKIF